MEIYKRVPRYLWMASGLLAISLLLSLVGISVTKSSIYAGLASLVLTILSTYIKKLLPYRRDLGIVAGFMTIVHVASAVNSYFNFTPVWLTTLGGQLGAVAYLVMLLMLITSSFTIQRRFKKWRTLHALIWFALPFIFFHAKEYASVFEGDVPVVSFVMIVVCALGLLVRPFVSKSAGARGEAMRDMVLFILGIVFSFIISFLHTT